MATRAGSRTPVERGGLEGRRGLGLALGRRGHPEQLRALWQDAVARSRSLVTKALADGGLDRPATGIPSSWGPTAPSLRWIVVHMIEEFARHNGHADLLRESVDGVTGE